MRFLNRFFFFFITRKSRSFCIFIVVILINTHFVMHFSERGTVEVQLVVDHFVYSFLHFVHIVDGHCSKFRVSVRFGNQRIVSFVEMHLWLSFGSVNHQLLHCWQFAFKTLSACLFHRLIPHKAVRQFVGNCSRCLSRIFQTRTLSASSWTRYSSK